MCVLELPKFAMRFLIVLYAVFVLSLATGKIEKGGRDALCVTVTFCILICDILRVSGP